jgi:hypothetical protein
MIARSFLILATILTISGCSIFGSKPVEIVSKPIKIDIIQPQLPRPIDLQEPKFYVVSEAVIVNPCKKVVQEDGTEKRPKECALEDRENPEWPVGYTYFDRFLDDMKALNNGDVLFVASTIKDYELMSGNFQELRRYIRELGEVIVYYRDVTINDEPAVGAQVQKK